MFIIKYVYAAISCIYLFLIGFLFQKNRALINTIYSHFGKGARKYIAILPKIDFSELIEKDISIQILEPVRSSGNVMLFELVVINSLIQMFKPAKIFEIGTFDGRTTLNMAANSSDDAKIYTLDLPKQDMNSVKLSIENGDKVYIDKQQSGSKFLGTVWEKKIVQLYGDSAVFDFSPFSDSIDFIFIDGSHSYEYVLNDSKQSMKIINKNKAVILWHDYGFSEWDGLTKALNKLYLEGNEFKEIKHIRGTSLVCLVIQIMSRFSLTGGY